MVINHCGNKSELIVEFLENRLAPFTKYYEKLSYLGNFDKLPQSVKTIGIVGSRDMTQYGKSVCQSIIANLEVVKEQIVIVSGLMYGVDLCAHESAIKNGISTIGVIGYGIGFLSKPPYLKKLVDEIKISDNSFILSQFEHDLTPKKWTFPQRNHLIASLSDVLIVVEAGQKSGSLITVNFMLDMGKDVLAVPGSIFSKNSKGCHQVIYEGSGIYRSVDDILNLLKISGLKRIIEVKKRLDETSLKLLHFIESKTLGGQNVDTNVILAEFQLPQDIVYNCLLNLEFSGLVERDFAGRYYAISYEKARNC